MKNLLLAVAVAVLCHQTAVAYWPTTEVARANRQRDKLPLAVSVTPLGDGTLEVKYEVILTGPFAHLQRAEILAADGGKLLLQIPIPIADAAHPAGVSDGPESVKGSFRVSKELLGKCRLRLECPVQPLSSSGQTFSVDLSSFLQ